MRIRASLFFAWYDIWVGVYVARWTGGFLLVYICPLPCCGIKIEAWTERKR